MVYGEPADREFEPRFKHHNQVVRSSTLRCLTSIPGLVSQGCQRRQRPWGNTENMEVRPMEELYYSHPV